MYVVLSFDFGPNLAIISFFLSPFYKGPKVRNYLDHMVGYFQKKKLLNLLFFLNEDGAAVVARTCASINVPVF
jgi:hypothetical protein